MSCGSTQCSHSFLLHHCKRLRFHAPFQGLGPLARRCALLRLYERQQQRRVLLELDDHMLADIGITREQAQSAKGASRSGC